MKTSFVSSWMISEGPRRTALDLQVQLARAQKEVSSGRLADVGLSLGSRVAQSINLRNDHSRLGGLIDTNELVSARLDATQGALTGILATAQDFLESLAVAHSGTVDPSLSRQQAQTALEALTAALNTTVNGEFLFGGINTDAQPMAGYFGNPPPASRLGVETAFQAAFGMTQSSPGLETIQAADMQAFLDTAFDGLFDPASWTTDWSAASDQPVKSQISLHETLASGTTANNAAFRKLAEAFTMVADLGLEGLNDETAKTIIDKAMTTVGEGIGMLSSLQASIGTAEAQVTRASERMSLQRHILHGQINTLETVDAYEAATRVNALLAQIETSYALTGRLQQLTLLNYL